MSTVNKQLTIDNWIAVAEGLADGDTVTIAPGSRQVVYYCTTSDNSQPVIKYGYDLKPDAEPMSMGLKIGEKLFCKGDVVLVMDATNPLVTTDVFA